MVSDKYVRTDAPIPELALGGKSFSWQKANNRREREKTVRQRWSRR